MRKRSTEILQALASDSERVFILGQLAARYGVTERTLRNDLAEINRFLRGISVANVTIDAGGRLVRPVNFDPDWILQSLDSMDTYAYKLSPEERQVYLLVELLEAKGYITMAHIADALYVTRATVLGDIETVRELCERHGAELVAMAGKGLRLDCEGTARTALLIESFRRISLDVDETGFFQRLILRRLNPRHTFAQIFDLAQEFVLANGLAFVDDVFVELLTCLFAIFALTEQSDDGEPAVRREDTSGREILDELFLFVGIRLGEPISQQMLDDFRTYRERVGLNFYVKTIDEIELYEVIMHFLDMVGRDMGVTLTDDSLLADALLQHIRSMRDWGAFDFDLPEINDAAIDYRRLLKSVQRHFPVLETFLGYTLNNDMRKSIVIHICVSLIRNRRFGKHLSVMVVCPGSMATGRLLEAQLRNYFEFDILSVCTVRSAKREILALGHVDLVLSTVSLKLAGVRVLRVHPVLTMEDMNAIQKACLELSGSEGPRPSSGDMLSDNLALLIDNKALTDEARSQLSQMLEARREELSHRHSALSRILEPDLVQVENGGREWHDAIRVAGEPLVRKGYVSKTYVERAIANVEGYGDYIVLGEGIALAHAATDAGAHVDAMGLLVSRAGIRFTNTLTPVKFLFFFSTVGDHEYIDVFGEIVALGMDEARKARLLELDASQIYQDLCYAKPSLNAS